MDFRKVNVLESTLCFTFN